MLAICSVFAYLNPRLAEFLSVYNNPNLASLSFSSRKHMLQVLGNLHTPAQLCDAAAAGQATRVRALLSAGVDVNSRDVEVS